MRSLTDASPDILAFVMRCALAGGIWLAATMPGTAQDAMARAAYLNTAYCQGAVEKYAARLSEAGGSGYRSDARKARHYATTLAERTERLRSRYGFKSADGNSAVSNGTSKMARLLPASGAWVNGGDIPTQAFRQYQNCVTLAQ